MDQEEVAPGKQDISRQKAEESSSETLVQLLVSNPQKGLSSAEAQRRLLQYGANALEEAKRPLWRQLIGYFWGPIPWMIEIAAILSAVNMDWKSFGVIFAMLVINGGIGFWEEKGAADALEALKSQLALKARVLRDGQWAETDASTLVPGDIIRLRLGDILPADVKLLEGEYLSVDQSALTGESLPVSKGPGEVAFSGTIAKQGEMLALVYGTGSNTFFGRTAKLVEHAAPVSHFQRAVLHLGNLLIFLALLLSVILTVVELGRGLHFLELIAFVLVVVVASIPVAMPAVLSVTMALGALALSRMKAIVSRLTSIEEMAGIDVLCSDKTGTLTQNKLALGEPVLFAAKDKGALISDAALACRPEDADAIDTAVLNGLHAMGLKLDDYVQSEFKPFDPVAKRTEATIRMHDGPEFRVTKGAPQVIMELAGLAGPESEKAQQVVEQMATKGYRTLAVARAEDHGDHWSFLGILPLSDPPREDSLETINDAKKLGVTVKMVTGDHQAIARDIAGQLGLGPRILAAGDELSKLAASATSNPELAQEIERADGFAQVFPEHKYAIVKVLQDAGHLVAMTGDGVNDAPALKQADVGIAVSGATDAARSAASLILTAPGLSVIVGAIIQARRIFERMMSYTMYRIAMTLDILFFVVLAMLIFNHYPLTAIMVVLLSLLDDIPIMAIAWDRTVAQPRPVRWEMGRVIGVSSALGALAFIGTFVLYLLAHSMFGFPLKQVQTIMFLQLIAGGHLMLFLTRVRGPFWRPPYPAASLLTAIVGTQLVGAAMAGFGWLMSPIPWSVVGLVWAYNLIWMVVADGAKIGIYRLVDSQALHQSRFLYFMNASLQPAVSRLEHLERSTSAQLKELESLHHGSAGGGTSSGPTHRPHGH